MNNASGAEVAAVLQPLPPGATGCFRYLAYIQVANLHFFLEIGSRLTAKNAYKDLKTRKKAHFEGIPARVIVIPQSRAGEYSSGNGTGVLPMSHGVIINKSSISMILYRILLFNFVPTAKLRAALQN